MVQHPTNFRRRNGNGELGNLKFALPGNCPARHLLHFENPSIFDCDITRHVNYGYRLFFYLFDAKKNIGNLITSSQNDKVQTSVIWLYFQSSHCCTHSGRVQLNLRIQHIFTSDLYRFNRAFHNSRLIRRIQQKEIYKQFRHFSRDWTQIACLAVRHINHCTKMFSVLVWDCNSIIFMHEWICPICIIHLFILKKN